jgi:hypothetical protein
MYVLNRDCLIPPYESCALNTILMQWVFILMTVLWTGIGIRGIVEWHKVTTFGVSYNQAIIYAVFLKFFLIYIGIVWGSSMTMLFIIFWFQAFINTANCFILHTIVQQFHMRRSLVGKIARGFFLWQFFSLWF